MEVRFNIYVENWKANTTHIRRCRRHNLLLLHHNVITSDFIDMIYQWGGVEFDYHVS